MQFAEKSDNQTVSPGLTPRSAAAYLKRRWVRSSAVEHRLHTAGVTGSIPVAPTIVAQQVAKATSALAAPDAVFTCEVGLRTVWRGQHRPIEAIMHVLA
jgi:hypothetical protein